MPIYTVLCCAMISVACLLADKCDIALPYAGQAFAKHYNPLLSGETSQGSQYSSEKQFNAITFRRFGEQMPSDSHMSSPGCTTGQSVELVKHVDGQYTAPTSQAMQDGECTSRPHEDQSEQQQELTQAERGLQDATLDPSPDAEEEAEQSHKQSSLGRQLTDALMLRNWKGRQAQPPSKQPDQLPAPTDQSGSYQRPQTAAQKPVDLTLSPRTESALMVAASELGFDAEHENAVLQPGSGGLPAAALPFQTAAAGPRSAQATLNPAVMYGFPGYTMEAVVLNKEFLAVYLCLRHGSGVFGAQLWPEVLCISDAGQVLKLCQAHLCLVLYSQLPQSPCCSQ